MQELRPVRGMKDLLGEEIADYNFIVETAKNISNNYGFMEVQPPLMEFTSLFNRTLGDSSDVVTKEMYNLADRNGESLTLRPEFTASICRLVVSNSLFNEIPLKLFSYGPLFRYERPQKGRQRQFHQINCEVIGQESPHIDAEIIGLFKTILDQLSIEAKLQINNIGCQETRNNYRAALVDYFQKYIDDLSEDSRLRLLKNPLRILDSKDEKDREIVGNSPSIAKFYSVKSLKHQEILLQDLENLQIKYEINERLVRGLDYYNDTVFEWVSEDLGSQSAVGGGGRYDQLFSNMGVKSTPAFGFGAGIERMMLLAKKQARKNLPISIIYMGDSAYDHASKLSYELRKENLNIQFEYGSPSKQMKKADKNSSSHAVILGEEEIKINKAKIRNLSSGEESFLAMEEIVSWVSKLQGKKIEL